VDRNGSRGQRLQERIEDLQKECKQHDDAFLQSLQRAMTALNRGRPEEAIRWVDHALHWEHKAQDILRKIRREHHSSRRFLQK